MDELIVGGVQPNERTGSVTVDARLFCLKQVCWLVGSRRSRSSCTMIGATDDEPGSVQDQCYHGFD